jgi:hypothetical protein
LEGIKLNSFYTAKELIHSIKRLYIESEIIFTSLSSNKGFRFRIYKEHKDGCDLSPLDSLLLRRQRSAGL